ncbi:hypothetical protein MNBD_BACTEROID06-876 [hydrothermal vent metagenome]|uniref:Lipocalin-like domain-containing protein n=1 Tax=hydrothermal vent metagenome TaxID=652676 RepID=A0A3B0UEL6_9ZZZZ
MKNLKITSLALLLGLAVIYSCKTDPPPEPSPEEAQTALLVGTWAVSSVTFDNTARDWAGFSLAFTDGAYTSTGSPSGEEGVWKTSGTWQFVGKGTDNVNVNKFTRDDDVDVSISVIDANNLTLTFNYDEAVNGKISGITGSWVFKMTK